MKSPITTHILDTSLGRPAEGVKIELFRETGSNSTKIGEGKTDSDGRVTDLLKPGSLEAGHYRIKFDTGGYYAARGEETFYPTVNVDFTIKAVDEHYHVPLLLNPYGFSTYRGS